MIAALLFSLDLFASEWKEDLRREITAQQNRSVTEKFLSDKEKVFRIPKQKASYVFRSKNQRKYYTRRHLTGGKLYPLWMILAAPDDQVRTEGHHETAIRIYENKFSNCPDCPVYKDTDIDENTRNAILSMIGIVNPKVKPSLTCQPRANNVRIPTHRRNGELYMNGRSL